jgi:hypothetical protein
LLAITACSKPSNTTTTVGGAATDVQSCTADQCGPRPMFFQMCPDGSGVGADRCERGPNGCAWQMSQCPTDASPAPPDTSSTGTGTTGPAECACTGDKPNMMALCPDGKSTIAATGKCYSTKDGCAWEMTKCP